MPTPSPGANLTYVYVPSQRPASPPPVVIFFHGGGYIDYADQGELARVLPQFANAARVVVVQPSYSLDPTFVTQNPPVVVTAARDAGCAIAWTERNIASWGGDKNRIVLAGDSAGASLAANVGLRTGYVTGAGGSANDPPITGVFGFSGRYDFHALQASYASTIVKGKTGMPPYALELTWPKWLALHGSGNDPVSAVAPSPYRWRIAYEECDEDGAYRDALEFARLMGASGNALGVFQDRDKYLSAGSQPAPYWHTPAHDAVEPHIAPYSAPSPPGQPGPYHLYAQLAAFAYGAQFPSPSPSWEPASTKAILPGWVAGSPTSQHWTVGTVGVRDVAVAGDGSVWVVTNDRIGTTGDYAIAQYGNFGDGSVDDACLSVPQRFGAPPPGFAGGGVRVAADASGFPWMLDAAGKLFALPGGLADQGYFVALARRERQRVRRGRRRGWRRARDCDDALDARRAGCAGLSGGQRLGRRPHARRRVVSRLRPRRFRAGARPDDRRAAHHGRRPRRSVRRPAHGDAGGTRSAATPAGLERVGGRDPRRRRGRATLAHADGRDDPDLRRQRPLEYRTGRDRERDRVGPDGYTLGDRRRDDADH